MEQTEQAQIPEVADQAVETHEEKKSPQESFAELRKAREDAERQAWQAKKELELLQKQMQSQMHQPQQQPQEDDYDFRQLEEQDYPDGKNIVKAFGKIDKKLSQYEQKLLEKDIKIRALQFTIENPDFKNVVTPENIEKYIKNDEDMRIAVEHSPDPLRAAYNLIKKSAAYQIDNSAKEKTISQEQRRVEEKDLKPKTGSMGVRSEAVQTAAQMSNSKMTREQKIALWKETQAAARK